MKGQLPVRTILAAEDEEGLSASHPIFYAQERSKYLQRLVAKTEVESDLPTNDLRRNLRVDHYLNQYNQVRGLQEKRARQQNSMLRASQFESIFVGQQQERRQLQRNKLQTRKIQEDLFKNYVQNPHNYKPAQRDRPVEAETILQMGGMREKELYLLDLEIGRIREEQKIEQRVQRRQQQCRNNDLLGRLSGTLISGYLVHFDQICGGIIDEILQDEVIFLNEIEAGYKIGHKQQRIIPNRKTVQMAELVRALDQLCDR